MAKKNAYSVQSEEQKEFIKLLFSMSRKRSEYEVFKDFLTLSCYALANSTNFNQERENQYIEIINNYEKQEQENFPKLLALITDGFERGYRDFLGEVYMACEFGEHEKGQFFTPYSVCEVCAEITLPNELEQNKIYTVADTACGAGALIIATAEAMHKKGVNFQRFLHATLTDISWNAVCMAMIQCSLLGIPATIIHGDTLSQEVYTTFETPMTMIHCIKERMEVYGYETLGADETETKEEQLQFDF